MNNNIFGRFAAVALLIGVVTLSGGVARAAGEWEWTRDQGWIMGAGVSRPTPKEQLQYAYELEQRGEFMDSARQYFLLVQNFPSSQEAGVGLQRLARCLFEMENYYTSYKAIEQVIETYPNTGRMSDLVEIELRIAKKMMVSQTPDILSGRESNTKDFNIRRALEIVGSVIKHDPYGPVAAEAYLVKGEAHLFVNEVAEARKSFEVIRDEFSRSDYVERARLGILTCDSLMGQAKPQELQEQIDLVRQAERERARRQHSAEDELDEVEESIRHLAEVEAAKMMEQAKQYHTMGTRKSRESSKFLYGEIVRRYPNTPQAEEAMAMIGNIKIPKEENRFLKGFKNININPFTLNRDPEPPWIVPQMDPEDMVMVDSGLGPIAGVPETAAPRMGAAAGVRPMALTDANVDFDSPTGNFSPIDSTPGRPAPDFIDGVAGQNYSPTSNLAYAPPSGGTYSGGYSPLPSSSSAPLAGNPLPTVSESDLVGVAGISSPTTNYGGYGTYGNPPIPEMSPVSGSGNPVLGSADYYTSMNDLVGPAPRSAMTSAPIPEYGVPDYGSYGNYGTPVEAYNPYGSGGYATGAPIQDPYSSSVPYYEDPMLHQPSPAYEIPGNLQPVQGGYSGSGGGWTMGEDFR